MGNKLLISALIIAFSVLIVSEVTAETAQSQPVETGWRLKEGMAGTLAANLLAIAPAYLTVGAVTHESTHAAVGLALGQKLSAYKPYPHWTTLAGGQNHFCLGEVEFRGYPSRGEIAAIASAPYALDIAVFSLMDTAFANRWLDPNAPLAWLPWLTGMVTPLMDMGINTVRHSGDFAVIAKSAGIPETAVVLTGASLCVIGLWRTVHQAADIFGTTSPKKGGGLAKASLEVSFSPILGNGIQGLAAIGQF